MIPLIASVIFVVICLGLIAYSEHNNKKQAHHP